MQTSETHATTRARARDARRARATRDCTTRCNVAQQLTSRARTTTRPRAFPPAGPRIDVALRSEGLDVGSVIKKRRKKMRKHKKRKLLKRARHKRKR